MYVVTWEDRTPDTEPLYADRGAELFTDREAAIQRAREIEREYAEEGREGRIIVQRSE